MSLVSFFQVLPSSPGSDPNQVYQQLLEGMKILKEQLNESLKERDILREELNTRLMALQECQQCMQSVSVQ